MNFQDLSKNLKSSVKACYLVTGDDLYFKKQVFQQFKQLVSEETFDFNVVYITSSISPEALFVNLQTPPLMSDYRVIFLSGENKKPDKDKAKAFEEVIKKWTKDSFSNVVLVVDNEDDNFKFLSKYSEIVDCKKQNVAYLTKQVMEQVNKSGYTIQENSAKSIVLRCNNDMMIIQNELLKLFALAEDKKITDRIVQEIVISNIEENVFKLTDYVAKDNYVASYEMMDNLLSSGEQPLKILAAISGQYRRMFICKVSKLSNSELSLLLGVKEFAIEISKRTAEFYKPMQLKKIVDKLQLIEYEAKSGLIGMTEGLNLALAYVLNRR